MGCNCKNNCGSTCERVVITKQGERGFAGPPGPQGPRGTNGVDGTNGQDGASYVNKVNSYNEFIGTVQIEVDPSPEIYHFPPGYEVLTYTNNTGAQAAFYVHGTWDSRVAVPNSGDISNEVDGAIIKTVTAVDSVVYESRSAFDLSVSLFDGLLAGDTINISSVPDTVDTTPGGNPVEVRFGGVNIPKNSSICAKVILKDGETVSLKFKTKGAGTESRLDKAQLFVNQLDQ